jgi:MerR family transcriptional regulator, thiopeptide resistance regulator
LTSRAMRIQEFAGKTGVTVRTLHHYDRLGLLQPQRTESGYRVYGERELVRLQRITVLKFIGCSLQEIKELVDRDPDDLRSTLDLQQKALERRRKSLDGALKAVDQARSMLSESGSPDWQSLKQIVETIEMEQNMEWTKQYYSPEALEDLAKRRSDDPTAAEQGQKDWAVLLADCEQAVKDKVDPKSERGRQLAQRWVDLVQAFTRGNPQIAQGLNKLYSDEQNWPSTFKRPWSNEVDAFIREAKVAANLRCEP